MFRRDKPCIKSRTKGGKSPFDYQPLKTVVRVQHIITRKINSLSESAKKIKL